MLRQETPPPLSGAPPPGVLPCVWMSAGLVSFKLCDREGECEGCPFDRAMRGPTPRCSPRTPVPVPTVGAPAGAGP